MRLQIYNIFNKLAIANRYDIVTAPNVFIFKTRLDKFLCNRLFDYSYIASYIYTAN